MAEEFVITEGYLATLDKRGLLELLGANSIGDASIADTVDEMKVVAAEKRTAKQLREAVFALAEDGRFDGFVPREIRIGSEAELKRPLTAPVETPPVPKKAPAKKAKKKIDAKSGPKVAAKKKPAAGNGEPAREAA